MGIIGKKISKEKRDELKQKLEEADYSPNLESMTILSPA